MKYFEWVYRPAGDGDEDKCWVDHFVLEGEVTIACPPTAEKARLIAAAPDMRQALLQLLWEYPECGCTPDTPESSGKVCGACMAREALDKVAGK